MSGSGEPGKAEVAARLKAAMGDLTTEEVRDLLERCDREGRATIGRLLRVRVDPARVRGGLAQLVVTRAGVASPRVRHLVAACLAKPVVLESRALLGDEAREDPSVDDLTSILGALLETFTIGQIRFAFVFGVCDEFTAMDALEACLESEPRLQATAAPAEVGVEELDPGEGSDTANGDAGSDVETAAQTQGEGAEDAAPEDDVTLFTSLDRLMITTAVATTNGQLGAPEPEELVELTEELLALNSARKNSYFHVGFVSSLLGREIQVPAAGLNQERRQWLAFGRLSGLARRDSPDMLAKAALDDPEATIDLVTDPAMGDSLAGPIVTAALPVDPTFAARLLDERQWHFQGVESTFWTSYDAGRRLLLDGRTTEAQRLFSALLPWSSQMAEGDDASAFVMRRLAACHRANGDMAEARSMLAALEGADLSPSAAAAIATEKGLIEAGIGRLTDVRFPRTDERRIALMEALGKGRANFERAFGLDPARPHAAYCLGVLAICEDRVEDAARLLEAAEAGMRGDPLFEDSKLRADTSFHRAAAMLATGEIGREDAAFASMAEALSAGCRPSPSLVVNAARALAEAGAPSLAPFVSRAIELNMSPNPLVPLVCGPAREGDQGAVDLALRMGGLGRVGNALRLDCLLAAFEGCSVSDPAAADRALDAVEDLLVAACSDVLDERWLRELEVNDALRNLISAPAADLLRADICRRLGRPAEAIALVGALARRAANGAIEGYDADDLMATLVELGASEDEIADCQAALARPETHGPVSLDGSSRDVRVLFVGGDERQAQHDQEVAESIRARFGDAVHLEFFHPGWSSAWPRAAERVEAAYEDADVVVLMPLVRTLFGRRIRRTSGEASLPWVACTGHGRHAIERAIVRAVEVVGAATPSAHGG